MPKITRDCLANPDATEVVINYDGAPIKKKKSISYNKDIADPAILRQIDGLTAKQRRFVQEYVKDYNGNDACRRAGYSPASITASSYQLMHNITVLKAIDMWEKSMNTRFLSTRERILKELSLIGYSDMGDYLSEDGYIRVHNLKELPPQVTRAIKKLRFRRILLKKADKTEVLEETCDFELYDKTVALTLMGKELGMFRTEVTGAGGMPLLPAPPTTIVFDFGCDKDDTNNT
jgi:phage terminase small subunit